MRTFRVELGPQTHPVHVGAGLLDRLGDLACEARLKPGRGVLVTDSNVGPLYAERALKSLARVGFSAAKIEIAAGETSKSLGTLSSVYDLMVEAELDRRSVVFALGGGVVGDLAGFAAASFMRGIPLVQVPTTVVAAVDSSLGGKTGVNHPRAKNLIGAFYQPRMIAADVSTLMTLGEREFREGLAEVIKYGAIMDEPMTRDLERGLGAVLLREADALELIVERSLKHKASVVERDEHESGLRKILNFGHTVGHAIEASAGYGNYLHGEAVAVGMVAAAKLSRAYAGLDAAEATRLEALIRAAGLPVTMPSGWRDEDFERALRLDKKRVDEGVEFVLIDRLGHAFTKRLAFDQIVASLALA